MSTTTKGEKTAKDAPEKDAAQLLREQGKSPELAAFLAWLVPGSGHLYVGQVVKGAVSLVLILGLFLAGLFISKGEVVSLDGERGHPYAFLAQVGVGLPTGLAVLHSKGELPGVAFAPPEGKALRDPDYVSRLPLVDLGLLFTMVAGLLNLLLIHDALRGAPGAVLRRAEERRIARRIERIKAELAAEKAAEGSDAADEEPDGEPETGPGSTADADGAADGPADEGDDSAAEADGPAAEGDGEGDAPATASSDRT